RRPPRHRAPATTTNRCCQPGGTNEEETGEQNGGQRGGGRVRAQTPTRGRVHHTYLVGVVGSSAASFEQPGGGKTVTGQCASHTLPRLRLLQLYKQYGAACIPHAALFPCQTSSSLILTDVILSFRTSVGLLTMYSRIYYLS
ncbi:hypothetical protein K443DRAFT_684894, partial [Laccaria amethystina LaAM-08-1]